MLASSVLTQRTLASPYLGVARHRFTGAWIQHRTSSSASIVQQVSARGRAVQAPLRRCGAMQGAHAACAAIAPPPQGPARVHTSASDSSRASGRMASTMPPPKAGAGADPKLAALRQAMAGAQVDAFLVPSEDPHMSEYPPDCFLRRQWISKCVPRSPPHRVRRSGSPCGCCPATHAGAHQTALAQPSCAASAAEQSPPPPLS
jgi:hypothetical protein